MRFKSATPCILVALALFGCNDRSGADEGGTEHGEATDDGTATEGEVDGGGTSTFGDDGACGDFVSCYDLPPEEREEDCNYWSQDCPAGEKCTITSSDETSSWDAYRCVPTGEGAIGEPCTTAEGPRGTDTCNADSLCYQIDATTGIGECVGFCAAPERNPVCPDGSGPLTRCKKQGNHLALCIPSCNPLLSGECPAGQVCVAEHEGVELTGFTCFPPATEGTSGEECGCANCCAAQHKCVSAEDFGSDCAFDFCCTRYCDTEDASFTCQGTDQVCVVLFDPNTPEFGNVGRCVLP